MVGLYGCPLGAGQCRGRHSTTGPYDDGRHHMPKRVRSVCLEGPKRCKGPWKWTADSGGTGPASSLPGWQPDMTGFLSLL